LLPLSDAAPNHGQIRSR